MNFVVFVLLVVSIVSGARVSRSTLSFQNDALKAANTRRAAHCSPPLRLDSELNKLAQKRADEICESEEFEAIRGRFRGKGLAESLYRLKEEEPIDLETRPGSEPITQWYLGRKHYDFELPGHSDESASFTQLVWASSKLVGFGVCLSSDEKTMYVVAKYSPIGNSAGLFESNVKPTTCE